MTADGVHRVHVLMEHSPYDGDSLLGVYTDETGAKNAGTIHANQHGVGSSAKPNVWRYEEGKLVMGSFSSIWLQVHEIGMDQFPKWQ